MLLMFEVVEILVFGMLMAVSGVELVVVIINV
jgi:hypothetical protein